MDAIGHMPTLDLEEAVTNAGAASRDAYARLHPQAPETLADTGLSFDLMLQLVLKTLHLGGELTGTELARRLGVTFTVIDPVLGFLKREYQAEIIGGGLIGGAAYRYRITDAGRTRALLFLEHNHYVGKAPVPLSQYRAYMRQFAALPPPRISPARVRDAFSHLVLSDRVLDQLGPAITANRSMFIYGPPGNGKSVISAAIRGLLDGQVAVPAALEVEGSIITLFDPVNHEPLPLPPSDGSLHTEMVRDERWVACRRPLVMVGGELTLDALDLAFNPASGVYHAPVQAIANGGVLVIDDFGRQRCAPTELLNRWVVPLENRVDYLTLNTGQKLELPFDVLVVFATNIQPKDLVDEAFLRRIHYKIFAESPSVDDFLQIFAKCCDEAGVPFERQPIEQMLARYYRPRSIAMRGCHPRDLLSHVVSLADYHDRPRELSFDLLESACASYFVDEVETPPNHP